MAGLRSCRGQDIRLSAACAPRWPTRSRAGTLAMAPPIPALMAGHAARNLAESCATNPAHTEISGSRCRASLGRYRREATWVAIVVSACS